MQTVVFANDDNFAQKQDSLLTLLEISPDRVKSKIFNELSDLAFEKDTSEAKVYTLQALNYANKYQAPFDLAQSHYQLGRILFYQDSLEPAFSHIKKSLAVSNLNEDDEETGHSYMNLTGKSLYYKASIYHQLYKDSAKVILDDLLSALEKPYGPDDYKMLADINHLLGRQYIEVSVIDKGLQYVKKAIEYYQMIGDKHTMAFLYGKMSYEVEQLTSVEYQQKAIQLYAETGDSMGMYRFLVNIAHSTRHILDSATNLSYLQKAYRICEANKNYEGMVYTLFHYSTYYKHILHDTLMQLKYLYQAVGIAQKYEVISGAGHVYIELGWHFRDLQMYDSAAYYLLLADSITAFKPYKAERIRYLAEMGDYYFEIGESDKAKELLKESLMLAQKNKDHQLVRIASSVLYKFYYKNGDYKNALFYYKKLKKLHDSVANDDKQRALVDMQIRYETDKMEHEIEIMKKDQELKNQQLKKREITIAAISSVLILILIFSGFIVWQLIMKRRAYNKLMEKNLQLIKCEQGGSEKKVDRKNNLPSIDPVLREQILKKLKYQIKQKKIYLKDDLTLNALAKKCQTNSSYLSKIIHHKYDTNFSGFINELRIKEAQKLMADENYQSYSIEGIAASVGFKTKSVFNTSFKKFTGVTPSYYLEYLNKSQVSTHAN